MDSEELEQRNPKIEGKPFIFGPKFMAQRVYNLSPPEVIIKLAYVLFFLCRHKFPHLISYQLFELGLSPLPFLSQDLTLGLSLIRPANSFTTNNSKETVMRDENLLTAKRYGSASRVFVTVEDDRALPVGFQRRMTAQSPDVQVEGMAAGGADHMAMLSRPEELAEVLVRIAGGI